MRKKIVAGNWKMNLNLQEGVALAKEINEALAADKPNCDVIICTPFIHLASVAKELDQNVVALGSDSCAACGVNNNRSFGQERFDYHCV